MGLISDLDHLRLHATDGRDDLVAMSPEEIDPEKTLKVFLAGDVMTGRGIDQALPYPGNPRLFERFMSSAKGYIELAERANGPLSLPLGFSHVWGDALDELDRQNPDLRIINLETAITAEGEPEPKGIHYRMNPANVSVLSSADIDCCILANNHVLDWGRQGLSETLRSLARSGITSVGAGADAAAAAAPAILPVRRGRVIVFAYGFPSSGVLPDWSASDSKPGVNFLSDPSPSVAERISQQVKRLRRPSDIVMISLHWGGNWGHEIPGHHVDFAHQLIDWGGADLVYGHSSHHPLASEVYQGKLILYGCGDFIDDYEGIRGHEEYRSDLVLLYLPELLHQDGKLHRLTMVPFQIRNFCLNRASQADAQWLCDSLNRQGARFGSRVSLEADGTILLHWVGNTTR
ncbi:CapA family protein [Roseibium sp.]|uniref:CapA family protein n=1 Tax=Roseibium sp. TaxID=1936156 RepID=UPI003A97453F